MSVGKLVFLFGAVIFIMGAVVGVVIAQGGALDDTPWKDPTPVISGSCPPE